MESFATHIPVQLFKPPRKFTLEEYLKKEEKAVEKHEFINGQIIKTPNARGPHNIIAANMMAQLIMNFDSKNKNFTVFASDQRIYFPALNEGAYADTLAVSDKPLYWDDNQLLLINPILVVEVLSKSTSRYDRTGKFEKYKTLESFHEYVLIRQDECYAEVWFRESPGRWQENIFTDIDKLLPLQSVDVSLSLQKIYKNITFELKN